MRSPWTSWHWQKVQGQNLNLFLLEQLPVITPHDYNRKFGNMTAKEIVQEHVLRLTYTANDMAPFARDLGYDGPPFIWDEEERRHLRARLDAALLPPLRAIQRGRGLRARHLPYSPAARRSRVRFLPHTRSHSRLHKRLRRGRHRYGGVGVGQNDEGSMRFTPRFSITNAIAAALTEIERARGFLDAAKTWRDTIAKIRSDLVAHLQSYGRPNNDILTVATVNRQLYAYLVARILDQCNFPDDLIKDVIVRASSEAVMYLPQSEDTAPSA